jgi:hypothetical protein
MIFRSDKGQGAQCESATLPSTHTPEGVTDKAVNIHLDKLITQREPVDYEATWVQRPAALLGNALQYGAGVAPASVIKREWPPEGGPLKDERQRGD